MELGVANSPTIAGALNRGGSPTIWLLKDGEPLPTDPNPRLMRTGTLAEKLADAGCSVVWWSSRFHHGLKAHRTLVETHFDLTPRYRLYLLDAPGYHANISLARIRHNRSCAARFRQLARGLPRPDLILGSYPPPELCRVGAELAAEYGVPFILDIRDPWPDMFPEYFARPLRIGVAPVVVYYRRQFRHMAQAASGIVAVSEAMLAWGLRYAGREATDADQVFYIGYSAPRVVRELLHPQRFSEQEPLVCAFVSSCGRSYDGATVVEAARLLEATGERRVRFFLTGDGEMRTRWVAQGAGLRSVAFTGYIPHEELQAHLASAHVGLVLMHGGITKYWLGNKVFEYLSNSLALVNNVPGEATRLVSRHEVGLSIPPRDAPALATAIRQLLASPEYVRTCMVNAGRTFAQMFERGRVYDRYVRYLAEHARHSATASTAANG